MQDLVAPRGEQLGDQLAVAPAPVGLGAHEAGDRLLERRGESLLPLGTADARGVAAERGGPDASETLLSRLAAEASAERFDMAVGDAGVGHGAGKGALVELRVSAGAGEAADVHEGLNTGLAEHVDEGFARSRSMARGVSPHPDVESPLVASSVTWDALRQLAGFRAEKGCAISLFLDLDPSVSPTPADAQTRVHSLLDEGEKRNEGAAQTHEQRLGLKADFERIREFFDEEFVRDGTRGYAVFCAGLDNLWQTVSLSERVPDEIKVRRDLYLAPLVPLVGRGDGAVVAVVSREQGRLYRLRAGRLEEVADLFEEQPRRHDQGGWSQARYQRHVDELARDHLKDVADELETQLRRLQFPRVVVVSPEELKTDFVDMLAGDARNAIVGWTTAEAHASDDALLKAALPVLEEWRERRETETIERWREEAGRNGRASSGWEQTLEAASDARVECLLFQEGVEHPAWACPACGRVSVSGGRCPLDGTQMEERAEGLDLAVHQVLAHGGQVMALRHRRDLEPVGGIGALLRF